MNYLDSSIIEIDYDSIISNIIYRDSEIDFNSVLGRNIEDVFPEEFSDMIIELSVASILDRKSYSSTFAINVLGFEKNVNLKVIQVENGMILLTHIKE